MDDRLQRSRGPWLVAAIAAFAIAGGAGATLPASVPSANAGPAEVAAQYLGQISQLKSKTMLVVCAGVPRDVPLGIPFMGGTIVKGIVMVLSLGAVCQPLQLIWRNAPIVTGHPGANAAVRCDRRDRDRRQ